MSNFEEFIKKNPEEIIERIFSLFQRNYEIFKNKSKKDEDWFDPKRLAWTADNFIKLNLINLWIRSKQPVNIMGETGVGKTALVEYLKDVSNMNYFKLSIHEGITEKRKLSSSENNDKLSKNYSEEEKKDANIRKEENDKKIRLVFFDEINTNFNVNGILKEIMFERTMNGKPIPDIIRFVSACNPFKIKLQKEQERRYTSGIK